MMLRSCLGSGGFSRTLRAGLAAAVVVSETLLAGAAWACNENAMIVFDASGSMVRRHEGRTRIAIARQAAADVLPDVTRTRRTGLITYGGPAGRTCRDVLVHMRPELRSGDRILAALALLQPLGSTALTSSVRTAAEMLQEEGSPGIVVLITDGLESCGGKACQLARELGESDSQIRVHVISFFLGSAKVDTLTCLTDETDGIYVAANSLDELRTALRRLLNCLRLS